MGGGCFGFPLSLFFAGTVVEIKELCGGLHKLAGFLKQRKEGREQEKQVRWDFESGTHAWLPGDTHARLSPTLYGPRARHSWLNLGASRPTVSSFFASSIKAVRG